MPVFLFNYGAIVFIYTFGLRQNVKSLKVDKLKAGILYLEIAALAPILAMLEGLGPFIGATKTLSGRQLIWTPTIK